ncbi:unnamed protein product [Adineta ricciae]|uniref:Tetratricopeptide repeat protein n=1 Tax=Adineta ricciae TaxID=249248 RepID=A0A814KCQ5_ADIRI|nr:unnamed protein product [Adineta ricciae]
MDGTSLIWLDGTVNASEGCLAIQKEFQSIMPQFYAFDNISNCKEYIEEKSYYDRIFFIVSGRLGLDIVPLIHQYRQVFSIYVFCKDKRRNELWAKKYSKVRGVIVKLDVLINEIKSDYTKHRKCRLDEPFPITFYNPSDPVISKEFLYSEMLLDYILQMKSMSTDKTDFIDGCLLGYCNTSDLSIVTEFQQKYDSNQSIWWYTRDSFLSRLLNKALSTMNLDVLFLCSFFIHDVQDRLVKQQCRAAIEVYHGQIMTSNELRLFREYIGQHFSINTFLWTTFNRKQAVSSLSQFPINEHLVRVLFEIHADPSANNRRTFATITHLAYFPSEEQALFQFGCVFQLLKVHYDKAHSVWIVKIALANVRHDYDQTSFLTRGEILTSMGKLDEAEKYYVRTLNDIPETHPDFARCHYQLGILLFSKGDYELSSYWFHEVLKFFRTDDQNLANSYYCIGCIYHKNSNHSQAIQYYEEALRTWERTSGHSEPIEVAECLNNMGCIYEIDGSYSKALAFYQRELNIREKLKACLGKTYNNIGNIYFRLGEYNTALEHYTYAFSLKIKSLQINDVSLVKTMINIGLVYECDHNYQEALKAYERARFLLEAIASSELIRDLDVKDAIQRMSALLEADARISNNR